MAENPTPSKPSIAGVFGQAGPVETFLGLPKTGTGKIDRQAIRAMTTETRQPA